MEGLHLQHVDHAIVTLYSIIDFPIAFELLLLLALGRSGFPRSSSSRVFRSLGCLSLRVVKQVLLALVHFRDSIAAISVDLDLRLTFSGIVVETVE